MERLLPEPCVCHTTPTRLSFDCMARTVRSTAKRTAKNWWYLAPFLVIAR